MSVIDVTFTLVEDNTSRTIGAIRVDEQDLKAAPELLNPVDASTVAIVKAALQRIEDDTAKVMKDLGR